MSGDLTDLICPPRGDPSALRDEQTDAARAALYRAGDDLATLVRDQAALLRASDPSDPETQAGAHWLERLAANWAVAVARAQTEDAGCCG